LPTVDNDDRVLEKTLEAEPWPTYIVDRTGRIVFTNAAWDRVAASANGPLGKDVTGTRWLDHTKGDELVAWQRALLDRVLERNKGEIHCADCNTPQRYRLFSTRYSPLAGREGPVGLVVLTSMIEDAPIEARYRLAPPDEQRHRQPTGFILQCGGCRRVHVTGTAPRVWEFVPEYVAQPRTDISHGICELCREVLYGIRLRSAG
jgi:hypothetical protein